MPLFVNKYIVYNHALIIAFLLKADGDFNTPLNV